MVPALIIEDEASARTDLKNKLAAHPEIEVVGEAATLRSARALLARLDYQLVFLDIQLVGGNSFELVPDVREGARIVFVTAYDQHALRAIEINALDYLLKPVKPERLAEALRRLGAEASRGVDASTETAEAAPHVPLGLDDILYLRSGLRARFAPVADISVITAADNYSSVHLIDGARIFLRKSLKAWEDALPATHFMRVHRTQIVNLARVTRYQRDGEERTLLFLEGVNEPVPASRYRWSDLRARLSAIRPAP